MAYHPEEESIYDEWGFHNSAYVTVDFLLPTGIYIPLDVERNASIRQIKKLLWEEAIHYPLFSKLANQQNYIFTYVTGLGLEEEIVDETKRLCEVDLLHDLPMLKLVKAQGNIVEKQIQQQISSLAGIGNIDELNKSREVQSFFCEYAQLADTANKRRDRLPWKDLLVHHHPPTMAEAELNHETHALQEYGLVEIQYDPGSQHSNTGTKMIKIKINPQWRPEKLTSEALSSWVGRNMHIPSSNPEDYVLKATGKEYIVGDEALYQFKAIRDVLVFRKGVQMNVSAQNTPLLTLIHSATVIPELPSSLHTLPMQGLGGQNRPLPNTGNAVTIWTMKDYKYNVKIIKAGNLGKGIKPIIHLGLYHGGFPLCNSRCTTEGKENPSKEIQFSDEGSFDFPLCDLPRGARLCFAICKAKTRKGNKAIKDNNISDAYAWVNMNVFDYDRILKHGKTRLYCWKPWPDSLDVSDLNWAGVVAANDEEQAPFIDIQIENFNALIKYPSFDEVYQEAARIASNQRGLMINPSRSHVDQLKDIVNRTDDSEMFEDEKDILWLLRLDVKDKFPEALPRFLTYAVKWSSYEHVAQVQALLQAWPRVNPEEAIALLGPQYADEKVREYAVSCLHKLSDAQIQQYLLQLTQVVKCEPYHDNALIRFLLDRSWCNRKIGHFFFWHFKSETHNAQVCVRFSITLHAYLSGNIPHMQALHRQTDALGKMKMINEGLKNRPAASVSEHVKMLRKMLKENSDNLKNIECTLDPSVQLEQIVPDKCKVMNSKMRPLWLSFTNDENVDNSIIIIYKNGDDLRQDMLTLQIISIMDMLWRSKGLDLRMLPYGCLPTGKDVGLIEVVTHANTIANIQKSATGTSLLAAFQQSSLLDWIKTHNPTPQMFDEAIDNFTKSCAGYCVATYVIGVGDRHSDNIMVTERGQLFHIDFGHILGNMKSKFGINRERVPFVLAHDFVYVINRGEKDTNDKFNRFKKLCDTAFLNLREKGDLFITLFKLMLLAELPELNNPQHLDYLRDSLALNLTEEEALRTFHAKFNKALRNAWSTSVNWFFHNVAKK